MNILALGAHPDDVELRCAGTLALYAQRGDLVTICHMCNGDKGSARHSSDEISRIRRQEAIESAKVIGAKSIWGGLSDGEIVLDMDCRIKVMDVIRQCNPDIVITNPPDDYHTDHINLSRLVFEATYMAGVQLMKTSFPSVKRVPYLYYMDSTGGVNFIPTEFVDITKTIETKIKMMEKMKSQIDWLKDAHSSDPIESIHILAKFRGMQAGVPYAEAFTQHRAYRQGLTKRILP